MLRWEKEPPVQLDAYIGYCPVCKDLDRLIFLYRDSEGDYEHAMECSHEWPKDKKEKQCL